jgi:hypothetical protein
MKNSSISLKATRLPIIDLLALARKIHAGFITHLAEYSMPKPAMPVFLLHILKMKKAIADWGSEGSRGGRNEHDAMRSAAKVVITDLRQLAAYAQSTRPNDADSWRSLGFALRLPRQKTKRLQKVQDLRRFIARDIPLSAVKLKWRIPLEAKEKNVKTYIIQRTNSPDYPSSHNSIENVLGFSTSTSFIDKEPMPGPNYYWVTPLNGAGMGVTSEPVFYFAPKNL